ncbi:MAG: hypothetical protein HZA27_03495 [Candidatus Omnitrophica bacterium]|nr:hypothetical protein [Candidatus Omnitrophota bacterium]
MVTHKKILITAGPTWVPIDGVRVISNIATGETGIMLAEKLQRRGAQVTLLLGPVGICCLNKKINPALSKRRSKGCVRKSGIKLIRFRFFSELKDKVIKELTAKRYDVIIHNAAVSDFAPVQFRGKISSAKAISLKLKTLPKIITYIRRLAQQAKLVMFKLEVGISREALIKKAKQARDLAKADLVVANTLSPYCAFIIDSEENCIVARNKRELVNKLTKLLVTSY